MSTVSAGANIKTSVDKSSDAVDVFMGALSRNDTRT